MTTHALNRVHPFISESEIDTTATRKETENQPGKKQSSGTAKKLAIAGIIIAAGVTAWKWHGASHPQPLPGALPSVAVSAPIQRELDTRLGFLGQFAAIEHVELRAQVGGTLSQIHFKDGDTVRKGDVLFTVDPTPYEIKLSQATAQVENATARLDLANQQLARARMLKKSDAGTTENVDLRASDQRAAEAALAEARALVRDAKFDLDRTTITAPFTGRIGTHQVSVGNLISGSRAGSSPTTLLATIVSLDPIYLSFDMSEADYLAFERQRANEQGAVSRKVSVALSDESGFSREGMLDFVDNVIDRSSGTIHVRATIPNKDLFLKPGAFGRVRLALSDPKLALLVPDASVLPDQSTHIVMTVGQDNVVKTKPVEIGDLRGGLRVIRSGLDAADRVVVGSIPTTAPGSTIIPVVGQIAFDTTKE